MSHQLNDTENVRQDCRDFLSHPNNLRLLSVHPRRGIFRPSAFQLCTIPNITIVLKREKSLRYLDHNGRRTFAQAINNFAQRIYISILATEGMPLNFLKQMMDQLHSGPAPNTEIPLPILTCQQSEFPWEQEFRINQVSHFGGSFLNEGIYDLFYHDGLPVPYDIKKFLGQGSIGTASSVYLWSHRYNFPSARFPSNLPESEKEFAVKTINRMHWIYAMREQEFVTITRRLNNKHLVKCYAAFMHKDTYHMIFEKGDKDLETLLDSVANANLNQQQQDRQRHRLYNQLEGLARTVCLIHSGTPDYTGYFHDLKLQNILVFGGNKYRLKLADWSCAKMNPIEQSSHLTETFGSHMWSPPEIFPAPGSPRGTSRPHDIWSLGCVFLELLLYIDNDWQAVQQFRNNRFADSNGSDHAFYLGQAPNITLRPSVVTTIAQLRNPTRARPDWNKHLDAVQAMLNTNHRQRWTAEKLVVELSKGSGVDDSLLIGGFF